MEQLMAELIKGGPLGILAGILVYDVFFLQRKLIQIIENNTKAITDLKSHCAGKLQTEP